MKKTKEMKINLKKGNGGITLVSLVITIALMLIITSVAIYTSQERLQLNRLNKMYTDIELLSSKVANYYIKYGALPVVRNGANEPESYTYTTLDFETSANDNANYYIIDLSAMEDIMLYYGEEGYQKPNESDDVYILNEASHTVYYVKGIKANGEMYHTTENDKSLIADNIPPSKPKTKIISGQQYGAGFYQPNVAIEIIPGNDNWSGIERTTYSINGAAEEDITKLENNILKLTEDNTYTMQVKTYDANGNFAETTLEIVIKLDHSEMIVPTIEATGNLANNKNISEVREGNIPIPAGFRYLKGDSIGGAVITDGINEFVWVPVTTEIKAYGLGTRGSREPDVITSTGSSPEDTASGGSYDAREVNLTEAGCTQDLNDDGQVNAYDFKIQLTNEFNLMAESVNQYHGFYVGRYETSFNANTGKAQSIKGVESAYNKNAVTSPGFWYTLYGKQREYSTDSIQGSMIWGSQRNAMMTWMKSTGTIVASTIKDDRNQERTTGTCETDVINNIYDLYGNSYEMTLEARNLHYRTGYSGDYETAHNLNYIGAEITGLSRDIYGSRLTLYIK